MIFDTLVRLDNNAQPQPSLAISWDHAPDLKRWVFTLRPNVKLHNNTLLQPAAVALSLQASNPAWKVSALADTVILESDTPVPDMPSEMARPRNAVMAKGSNNVPLGTGPFRVAEWQGGTHAMLQAFDGYWGGRPFLDAIDITMGRALRDQLVDLETGKADVIECSIDQVRRLAQENRKVLVSAPDELIAIDFSSTTPAALRRAISLSIDRPAINSVLLQRLGEPTGALLPQWLTGYAFLFPVFPDLDRARQLRSELPGPVTLAYDGNDALLRSIAERIALDARQAGIPLQSAPDRSADANGATMHLIRVPMQSSDAVTALAAFGDLLDPALLPRIRNSTTPQQMYDSEKSLIESSRLVPVVYVPDAHALSPSIRNWTATRVGAWRVDNVWLEAGKP
jgi:peptide/nickel transport system substrate-binding protein